VPIYTIINKTNGTVYVPYPFGVQLEKGKLITRDVPVSLVNQNSQKLQALIDSNSIDLVGAVEDPDIDDRLEGATVDEVASAGTIVDQSKIVYVGKHGDNANNGYSIDAAKLTFGSAMAQANSNSPSASNRWTVVCLDAGIYDESLTSIAYIDINAPGATLQPSSGDALTVVGNSTATFKQIDSSGTTDKAVFMGAAATGTAHLFAERILTGTGSFGVINQATGLGILIVKCNQIIVNSVQGIGDVSGGQAHTHVEIEDLYLARGGVCYGIARNSTGTTIARIGHILEIGAGVGNGDAVRCLNGTVDLQVGTIAATTAYHIETNGVLNMLANSMAGAEENTGKVNVTVTGGIRQYVAVGIAAVEIDSIPKILTNAIVWEYALHKGAVIRTGIITAAGMLLAIRLTTTRLLLAALALQVMSLSLPTLVLLVAKSGLWLHQ
jgi:hypothetical protein